MRSTQEWEATLEEATPGPWKVLDDHPGEVGTADNRYWIAETYQEEIQYSEGDLKRAQADARLIASAPEAVAEVVRLRRELKEWMDHTNEVLFQEGVKSRKYLDENVGAWPMMQWAELHELFTVSERITRILEDTHE